MKKLSHIDSRGEASMVDVSVKPVSNYIPKHVKLKFNLAEQMRAAFVEWKQSIQ